MTDQLGTLLRRLRAQAGLTQEQVAERSGVSVRTIRRLESGGSTDHRLGTVNLLADALDLGREDRERLVALLARSREGGGGGGGEGDGGDGGDRGDGLTRPTPRVVVDVSVPGPGPGPVPESVTAPVPLPVGAPDPVVSGGLADMTRELATEVRRRLRREEAQRRVHDPFPLPVRWRPAPAGVTDRSDNIQRLGPGAVPREVDLSGDLRSVAEVYRRISSGRLVVLGRAGSGKSILTIRFVLDHLEASGGQGRVPVVFGLGSWDPTTTALRDWLIGRLLRDHPHLARRGPRGATLAAALVDADLVLPVLDGFDEIAEGLRQEALESLNATSLPLVLTSRPDEFAEAVRAAHAPLLWAAGLELTDLTHEDLVGYLPRTARPVQGAGARGAGADAGGDAGSADTTVRPGPGPGSGLWDRLLEELGVPAAPAAERLAAVLTTPLMVVLARTMYSEVPDRDPAELLDAARFPTVRSLEEHLLAGFVPASYRRHAPERDAAGHRPRPAGWDAGRAERWLGYLAQQLVGRDRDRQDLAWWRIGDSLPRSTRVLAVVVATALSVAVADWLVGLLNTGTGAGETFLQGCLMGPVAGLAFGSAYALVISVRGGTAFEPARVRLRQPGLRGGLGRRPVRTFAARFRDGLLGGFVMGVGYACALSLERAVFRGTPLADAGTVESTLINMVCFGLIFGSAAALVFGLVAALEAPVDVTAAATPVSLLAANRATVARQFLVVAPALTVAIAGSGSLVVALLQGVLGPLNWRLADGLLIGAVGGVGGGVSYVLAFTAWGQWVVLTRVWLPLTGRLPWDTAAFLDDAYHRGVLRQTGAVYQFRHARLQHHLGRTFRERQRRYTAATFPSAAGPGTP
ncbi:helix-turn-helix domain-containing protein [Streptomyces sp. L2]|uniref:helix-turn-helix transcriptional regulator n=1 Tax=Streptomyces sp. L2 TaxID=2162665 RepID=UPI001012F18B|nr:helix-turn-helix domain-containing protein [Streptomyces sp. L2]